MSKGLQTTLWILSSLAVLWTVSALFALSGMGAMMHAMNGTMSDAMMAGMMLCIGVTWVVMLGLVGVFVYLLTAKSHGRLVSQT